MRAFIEMLGKVSFACVFAIYGIGYLIWHAHLSQYGISHQTFLNAEFLSAACCYLIIIATFSIPPAFLVMAVERPRTLLIDMKHAPRLGLLWVMMVTLVLALFFPQSLQVPITVYERVAAVLAVHLLMLYGVRKLRPASRLYTFLSGSKWLWVYCGSVIVTCCWLTPSIDKLFIVSCLSLYFVAFVYGFGMSQLVSEQSRAVLFLKSCILGLVVLLNVYAFGARQFGLIPKALGGGKPELVNLYIAPGFTEEMAKDLALPWHGHEIGLVLLLLKTDTDVTVIPAEENTHNDQKWPARQIRSDLINAIMYLRN